MQRIKSFFKGNMFICVLLLLVLIVDTTLSYADPVGKSTIFIKNDFEKTSLTHPQKVYDKVFFGNSVVISSYIEAESGSGYVNLGIDYGTIEDLNKMLDRGMITVGSDLVIGLNYLTFLDTLDTNPTYPWHRHIYEPYVYFQRDRIYNVLTTGVNNTLAGESFITARYSDLNKSVYYGGMTGQELDDKIATHRQLYWGLGEENFNKNFAALENLLEFCGRNHIRLRVIWMPWNPYIEMPEVSSRVMERANSIFAGNGIEIDDLTNRFPRSCFHDLGHLNYEYGAHVFTKEVDQWLVQ